MPELALRRVAGVVWLLALAVPSFPQYDHLATTDDGEVLYFSSSLRMRGSNQLPYRKLFVADATGVRLHTQRDLEQIQVPESTWPVSTYYSIEAAALNGDGSIMGVIARRNCYAGSGCLRVPKYQTEQGGAAYRGQMSLSRNGRFALLTADGAIAGLGTLIDLSTGERREWLDLGFVAPPGYGRRRVTADGAALLATPTELQLQRLNGTSSIPVPDWPQVVVVDDEGVAAVYEAAETGSPSRKLIHVDLSTGATALLATSTVPMQPCMSNDGRVVLFLAAAEPRGPAQMFLINADGTGQRQLTVDQTGITEIVLSGNGKVAYAVTAGGRLLRIDTDSGATRQVIGRSMTLTAPSTSTPPYPVPGSAFSVSGNGFADSAESAAPPLPTALNGVDLFLDGRPLPLQTVAPTKLVFQVPWDVSIGKHRLEVKTDVDGVFELDSIELEIRHDAFPGFAITEQGDLAAAHHDFSRLVTAESPARAGDILHLYMIGLGPVEPAVESGTPAPFDPLSRVVLPFSCRFARKNIFTEDRPVDVLFAGLAPGFSGYYQVSIRVPEGISSTNGIASLVCGYPETFRTSSAEIPVVE